MVLLINPFNRKVLVKEPGMWKDDEGNLFPVKNGVTRVVPGEGYTGNFGFQWNKFEKVQVDRDKTGVQISKARFFSETGWDKENLDGKDVLEVGCGAGRFSQVVLEHTKANLYSVDLSEAVEANYRNNNHYGNRLQIFQASIYDMPFADNSFDKVFCIGVLQHTPDFKKSVFSLASKIKPGGELVVDFYPITGWWTKIHAKYLLRPFTKKMSNEKLLRRIDRNANRMIAGYRFFDKIRLGKIFNRFIPVTDIKHTVPAGLDKKDFRDWVVLDTFDMFSPAYDKPQRIATVKKWFQEAGLRVTFAGFIHYDMGRAAVVKGIKPN
jgi:2-polyprenyl-3-methyl-5-hydroxy-6-metoxy-1,4-benzoquinol methylase